MDLPGGEVLFGIEPIVAGHVKRGLDRSVAE
jgi:hypothetical protein